jgi:hypothetical protein
MRKENQNGLTMTSLKIMEENTTIGIIPAFDTELSLVNLRREIEEDFEIREFDFQYRQETGQQINTQPQDEDVTKVVSVAQLADEVPIINIIKRLSNRFKSCGDSKPKTDHTSKNESVSESSMSTGGVSFQKAVSTSTYFLRSPTSWEIRGVKVYTEAEITKAKGMGKKGRLFWNDEAKKLCKDTTKSKGQVAKSIDIAWREHQSTLLLEEEALLSQMNSTTNTDPEFFGKTKCKPGTIKNNADQIRQHTVALDEVNTQSSVNIFQGPSEDKKRKVLVDRKKYHLTELKKAQDAMRKNLKASMTTIKDLPTDIDSATE